MSGFGVEYRCAHCQKAVSEHTVFYSNGWCPLCGKKGKHAGTIMDVTEHPYWEVKTGKWWQFWIRKTKQYLS